MNGCNLGEIGHSLTDDTPVSIAITRAGIKHGALKLYFAGELREVHVIDLHGLNVVTERVTP